MTSDPTTGSRTLHKLDREGRLITWKSSEGLGWNIAGIADLNKMYQSSVRVQRLFLTVTLLLLLGSAVLTFLSSRSMYKPILRLLQLINTGDSASRSKGSFS
ncbi:hypothetical protein N6H14_21670 [Paenibacillus sp. CC-CFT747]|nr:hypothetical protein N6H14_21670 [Paenibacillus sp. CC-CFT747]